MWLANDVDAFRDSFAERLPLLCFMHNIKDPIGKAIRAQVLPTHNEIVARLSDLDAVPTARRAFSQLQDGTLTDTSFGYTQGREFPHPNPRLRAQGVRQIPRAVMKEFSVVAHGAIPGAVVTGLRADAFEGGSPMSASCADHANVAEALVANAAQFRRAGNFAEAARLATLAIAARTLGLCRQRRQVPR